MFRGNIVFLQKISDLRGVIMKEQEELIRAEEYQRILKAVYEEKLFADPHLGRDSFAAHMNISRHTLNKILNSNANGQSFPQWINTIRIEAACGILRSEPKKTIAAVAKNVGLTPNNFHRLFRLQFGMTPSQYKQKNTISQTSL